MAHVDAKPTPLRHSPLSLLPLASLGDNHSQRSQRPTQTLTNTDKPFGGPAKSLDAKKELVDPCKVQQGAPKPKHIAPQTSPLTGLTGMAKLRAAGLRVIPMPFDLKPIPKIPPRNPMYDPAKL
ncbi:hypothetical protein NBRC10512v2_005446 [Rhodotorula toruloides]|uniref:RHTO0S09e08130g1_1 n=2 Tax=Rhodotorula toruloides TaxID=5286 RepID=A0A061B470_RHOTO|nr:uncharacterized protein RHTO_03891 [Rhodotorula toruloides NP11]EMS19848.1 hypothetical protein RHTO_03891 [Rhodotorula toruloides NP11]CDR44735.1 RHTO0S09e08130g1_1 [Rhodotorula toruloides]